MIIDSHTHIFSPDVIERRAKYCASDRCFGLLYGNPKARLCTAEDLIHSMDEQGIDVSVVHNIGWSTNEMCVRSNDYILEAIGRHPGRLIGFCAIQPREGEKALAEMERCSSSGIKGVGELRPDVQDFDLCDTKLMRPIINSMIALGMVLSLHVSEPVGHDYPGKGGNTPDIVYRFMSQAKGLKVILAHMGGGLPFYEMMPEVGEALSDAWYDTAAGPFLYKPAVYRVTAAVCGMEKMLFGSDWPLLSQQRVIAHIRESGLDKAELDAVLGGNAQRLFKLVRQ
ncbi:MAG: amidohydrolase family protein [Dehalococcoidia bacterium]|nr:amidohydrolase family protein [Dehalococcoidia bacterium]